MRYFFDIQDGDRKVIDMDGNELGDLQAAEIEAAQTIAEIAKDAIPGTSGKFIAISVRDDKGVCLSLELNFTMTRL
jgi:hypothetical protein